MLVCSASGSRTKRLEQGKQTRTLGGTVRNLIPQDCADLHKKVAFIPTHARSQWGTLHR